MNIVSEPINSYGINLAKPTVVVTAIGCMVIYLKFFDYIITISIQGNRTTTQF